MIRLELARVHAARLIHKKRWLAAVHGNFEDAQKRYRKGNVSGAIDCFALAWTQWKHGSLQAEYRRLNAKEAAALDKRFLEFYDKLLGSFGITRDNTITLDYLREMC